MEGWTEGRIVGKGCKRGRGKLAFGRGDANPIDQRKARDQLETGSPKTLIRAEKGRMKQRIWEQIWVGEDNGLRKCREESRVRDTEGQAGDTGKGHSAVTFHSFHLAAHPTNVRPEL